MEGIQWMCCWESFQKSHSIFKTDPRIKWSCQNILPVSYLGMPIKLLLHMQVYADRSWYAEPFFSADWVYTLCPCVPGRRTDRLVIAFASGAALNEKPAGQLCWHRLRSLLPTHRAILPPLLPEHCSVLTVSLFPVALQWQNRRQALTAHFVPLWQAQSGFSIIISRVTVWGVCWACGAY